MAKNPLTVANNHHTMATVTSTFLIIITLRPKYLKGRHTPTNKPTLFILQTDE
jgi:hypothetical protein